MSKGIRIIISRLVERRERCRDDTDVLICTGICWRSVGSVPYSPKLASIYGNEPKLAKTRVSFAPPGFLPRAGLGYPRVLPTPHCSNDNFIELSARGRWNAAKAIQIKPAIAKALLARPPRKHASSTRRYSEADEREESLLSRLSKKYLRQVFINDQGRCGYFDDDLAFIFVD